MPTPSDDTPARGDATAATAATGRDAPARVLLLDIDPAMADLFEEWLAGDGLQMLRRADAGERIALILIDLPFPREDGAARLRRLAQAWPGVPVLVLSSTFFAGVSAQGAVARQLGVAAVLPAPVARDTLRSAVSELLGARP